MRSMKTVFYPATNSATGVGYFDGEGLRLSTVNSAGEPCWGEFAHPSFAFVLGEASVLHPPCFRLRSTSAPRFLHPLGRATTLQLRGFALACTILAAVRCKRSNRTSYRGGRCDGVPPRHSFPVWVRVPPVVRGVYTMGKPSKDCFYYIFFLQGI